MMSPFVATSQMMGAENMFILALIAWFLFSILQPKTPDCLFHVMEMQNVPDYLTFQKPQSKHAWKYKHKLWPFLHEREATLT